MKKTLILLPLVGILFCVVLSGSSSGPGLTGDGDRTGATGTPGCSGSGCHSSAPTTAITVQVQLYDAAGTTLISPAVYTGGMNYTLVMTGTNTGSTIQKRFGFQLTAVKTGSTSTSEGTLTAISGTHV